MDRAEFLKTLYAGLSSLPDGERRKWRDFYAEMIDDRMEEGLSEQQAVAETGDPAAVIEQIYAETPLPVIIKQKIKPKRSLRAWEIVLICLGAPVWAPLIIAVFAVILSVYISLCPRARSSGARGSSSRGFRCSPLSAVTAWRDCL